MIIQIQTHKGHTKAVSVHKRNAELYLLIIEIARQRLSVNPRETKKELCRHIAGNTPASESTAFRVLTEYYEL